ncbi:MAG: protein kinase [Ignavibacteriaceae bacterium]|nr:protein kinase [Ignavibacteriaceae bacterium]
MIGSVIENYKIISMLGEGGMGVVYKALDMKLERFVALKILGSQAVNNPQFIERFKREARNQAKLNHPNIVPVYGFTDQNGILGIAMEYVEGETLERMVIRKKRLEPFDALSITKQICSGVGYAHSRGFIHRDIKPSNIIINREGVVKIMDFGISKSIAEKGITKTGTKIGTILYMSPEQIKAEEPTRQSDIYSIGITLYEMLVGKTPFDYGTEYEIMEGHLKKVPQRVSASISTIPPEVDKIVSRAIDKNQIKRYRDCDEFITEIDDVTAKYNMARSQTTQQAAKPVKEKRETSHKVRVFFITLLVLGLFAGLGYVLFSAISDFWPSITKQRAGEVDTTDSGYSNNPSFKPRSSWLALNSGITSNLNSLTFVNYGLGFAVGEGGVIIKSTDGGNSWERILPPDSLNFFDVRYNGVSSLFVTADGGKMYKSADDGLTWLPVPTGISETLFRIYFIGNGNGYAVGSRGAMIRTTDNGLTWTRVITPTQSLLYSVHFFNSQSGMAVGWNGTIIKTTDGGYTWRQLSAFTDKYFRDIYLTGSDEAIVVAAGGEIYRTTDGGENWLSVESKTNSGLVSVLFTDDSNGIITGNKGEILESFDGGKTWSISSSGNYYSLNRAAVVEGSKLIIAGFNGIVLTNKN